MGRRHKFDIVAEILRLAQDGSKKTRIVYMTNLNFNMLNKYMGVLIDKGFIECSDDKFFTASRGLEFLDRYEELMNVWSIIETRPPRERDQYKVRPKARYK